MSQAQKKIFKSIAVFGSVQFLSLAAGVVRSKFAALWIGAQGIGLLGLILSAFGLITSVVNLGVSTSLVKYLSASDEETLPKKLTVAKAVMLMLGIMGAVLCVIFAKPLSLLTFQTADFAWAFRLISVGVIFKQVSGGFSIILQSRNFLQKLASANVFANILGVFCTLPIYYFFHQKGIIYNLVAVGFVEVLVFYFFFKNLNLKEEKITSKELVADAKFLIGDGFYYSLSGFITLLATYLVQVFIGKEGGMGVLGFYVSGFTILNTYVSVIFTAMSFDYFPRISKVANDLAKLNEEVNHQLKVGMILLFPILLWLIIFCPLIVKILYSKDFLPSSDYVEMALTGIFFKMLSWILAFTMIAKSEGKMYLYNESFFSVLFAAISIFSFKYFGLKGLGIGYTVYYFLYLAAVFLLTKRMNIVLNSRNSATYVVCSSLIIAATLINYFVDKTNFRLVLMIFGAIFASLWSLKKYKDINGFRHS